MIHAVDFREEHSLTDDLKAPLDVLSAQGTYIVRQVFRAAFFVRQPHLAINAAIIAAIGRILDSKYGANLSFVAGATGDWFARTPAGIRNEVATSLADERKTINGTISISSDPDVSPADYYLEYNGFATDRPVFKNRASFLFFWLPWKVFLKDPDTAIELVLDVGQNLPLSCGHADCALIGKQIRKQQIARRYVGIDISDISSTAIDLADKASGAYWLSMVNRDLAERLGGVEAMRRLLPSKIRVAEMSDGKVALFLSDLPERGDRNNREVLPSYEAFARLLSANALLHVPTKAVYFKDEDRGEDVELQRMWHRRFVDAEW